MQLNCVFMQIIPKHAIAQNPYFYYKQKSPDLYDRMCFNLRP